LEDAEAVEEAVGELEAEDLEEAESVDELEAEDLEEAESVDELEAEDLEEAESADGLEAEDLEEAESVDEVEDLAEAESVDELEAEDLEEAESVDELESEELAEAESVDELESESLAEAESVDGLEAEDLAVAQVEDIEEIEALEDTEEINEELSQSRMAQESINAIDQDDQNLEELELLDEVQADDEGEPVRLVRTETGSAPSTMASADMDLDSDGTLPALEVFDDDQEGITPSFADAESIPVTNTLNEAAVEELETSEQHTEDELTDIVRKEDLISADVDDFEDAADAPADELEIVYEITRNRRFFGFVDEDVEELLPVEQNNEAHLQETGTGPDYYQPIPERFTAPAIGDLIRSRAAEAQKNEKNIQAEAERAENFLASIRADQVHELEDLDLEEAVEEIIDGQSTDWRAFRLSELELQKKTHNIIIEEDGVFRISNKAFKASARRKNPDFEHLVNRVTGGDEESQMAGLFDVDIDLGVDFGENRADYADFDEDSPVLEYVEDLDQLVIRGFDDEMQRFRWLKEVSSKLGSVAVSLFFWSRDDQFEHSISLGVKEHPALQNLLLSADVVGKLMESCIVDLGSKQIAQIRKSGGDRLFEQIESIRIIPFYHREIFYTAIFYFTNEVSVDLKSFLPVLA
jgi:hypothetical protein